MRHRSRAIFRSVGQVLLRYLPVVTSIWEWDRLMPTAQQLESLALGMLVTHRCHLPERTSLPALESALPVACMIVSSILRDSSISFSIQILPSLPGTFPNWENPLDLRM